MKPFIKLGYRRLNKEYYSFFILTIFLFIMPFNLAYGQINSLDFKRYGLEDGLTQLHCNVIYQDKTGCLWVGSDFGLNRFNGESFDNFYATEQIKGTISHSTVRAICEDSEGELWFGTAFGLNRFDREHEKFIEYYHLPSDEQSLSDNYISCLYSDSKGDFWVGTRFGGLNLKIKDSEAFLHFKNDIKNERSLSSNNIQCIYEDSEGNIWVGTDNGLNLLDREKRSFKKFQQNSSNFYAISDNNVTSIVECEPGKLIVGTRNGGINLLDVKKQSFSNRNNSEGGILNVSGNTINSIYKDPSGCFWIGTESEGLFKWNQDAQKLNYFKVSEVNSINRVSNRVWSIYEDRSGVLWVGSIGLYAANIYKKKFVMHLPKDKLGNDIYVAVRCFHKDNKGNMWLGTENKGLYIIDSKDRIISHYFYENSKEYLNGKDVFAIYEDNQGDIWVGTENNLNRFDKNTKTFIEYHIGDKIDREPKLFIIRSIVQDYKGNVWVGMENNGLYKFNKETKEYKVYRNDPSDPTSLSQNSVFKIYEDRNNDLWVATWGGLNKFDHKTEGFVKYSDTPENPDRLAEESTVTLYEDHNNNLWLGTFRNGLKKVNKEEKRITIIENDFFDNNTIYGILDDIKGNLWISHERGLSKYNPKSGKLNNYNQKDGLQSNEFNGNACYKDKKGILYFGGPMTFNSFYPDSIVDNQYQPRVIITSLKIFNERIEIGQVYNNRMILDKPISETKSLEILYSERIISFDFMSTSYVLPEKNQYAYMLEGFDKDWNYIGNRRFLSYTNVPPGEYTLKIKSSNNDGIWNEQPTTLAIVIKPPLWNTILFKIIAGLVFVGIIFSIFKIRLRVIENQKRELEKKIVARTFELKGANELLLEKQEELSEQNDLLSQSNEEILSQRLELEKLSMVARETDNSVIIADDKGKIEWVNEGFTKMFGYSLDEFIEINGGSNLIEDISKEAKDYIQVCTAKKKGAIYTTQNETKSGRKIWVQTNLIPVLDESGNVKKIFIVDSDITKLKETENELMELNATKDKLFSIIAHDLRSPFNVIIGFSDLLLNDTSGINNEEQRSYLESINNASVKTYKLLDNLLTWSRAQTGRIKFNPEEFSLGTLINGIMLLFEQNAEKKNIKLAYIGETKLSVKADKNMIEVVIRNLVSNAIKFTSSGGEVTIETKLITGSGGEYVKVGVRDSGVGIPPELQSKLFKVTENISTKGTNNESGAGLGLILCKEFVDKHGGKIRVISEPGQGSEFVFTLPIK